MRGVAWCAGIAILGMGCGDDPGSAIRLTLDDGQVIVGTVRTAVLPLEGALGALAIPLEHVGEVVPVEGHDLEASNGHVTVWLRNGTELRGRWADPALAMDLSVGGEAVGVELPMVHMVRFQTPGSEAWPTRSVFRVKTIQGDDLLVDPKTTRITLTNGLGTFSPTLSECLTLQPVGAPEGDWRIELSNGSVLIGPLAHDALTFALPMGPDQVEIPVANLAMMSWQDWGDHGSYAAPVAAEQAQGSGDRLDWFDNSALGRAKSTH